jgi:hypothetical protein
MSKILEHGLSLIREASLIFEQLDEAIVDFYKSVNTLIKNNKGEWKSDRQGKFLLNAGKNISRHSFRSTDFKKASDIAKKMGHDHGKNSIVVAEKIQLKEFGRKTKSKIRYHAFMTILDSGGVVYHGKVKVDHPKSEGGDFKMNFSKVEQKFKRDPNILPEIVVDFFNVKVDEKMLKKVNEIRDKIEDVIFGNVPDDDYKGDPHSDHDMIDSFRSQIKRGKTLSPKQMIIFNKIASKFGEKEADIGLGDKSEWKSDFNKILNFMKKLGDVLLDIRKDDDSYDNDEIRKGITDFINDYKKGNYPDWHNNRAYRILKFPFDELFRTRFVSKGKYSYANLEDLILEVPKQIIKASKTKKPTKKAIKTLTDMRRLADMIDKTSDGEIRKVMQKH